ncbi:MAG: TVP38/TMEM64 family protein, partial [Cyanobacteria bacterium J06659_2]
SQRHLERIFFLMTGFLMTGFFDFVSYGVGLTKAPWFKFAPALVISIAVSNPPIVALGAGLLEGGRLMLGFALLGVFGLAIVTGLVQRYRQPS